MANVNDPVWGANRQRYPVNREAHAVGTEDVVAASAPTDPVRAVEVDPQQRVRPSRNSKYPASIVAPVRTLPV